MIANPTKHSHSTSVTCAVSESGHSEAVLGWREDEFRRLGFAEYVADFLASTKIDLTQMETLLKSGCPHDLAAQILMGTTWAGEDETWGYTDESAFLKEKLAAAEQEEIDVEVTLEHS